MVDGCFPAADRVVDNLSFVVRPLSGADAISLGEYFTSLSETTRNLYGPHPFTKEQAVEICDGVEGYPGIRVVAERQDGAIIGYFILTNVIGEKDRERYAKLDIVLDDSVWVLAPSVADEYQNCGVGSVMMEYCVAALVCSGAGRLMLMGGVKDVNTRGRHFYAKHGFQTVGEFDTGELNHDMIMDLPGR